MTFDLGDWADRERRNRLFNMQALQRPPDRWITQIDARQIPLVAGPALAGHRTRMI